MLMEAGKCGQGKNGSAGSAQCLVFSAQSLSETLRVENSSTEHSALSTKNFTLPDNDIDRAKAR